MNIFFIVMVIFLVVLPFGFGKTVYEERYRTTRGSLSWGRYILPNEGDCETSCKAQCDKDDYYYVVSANTTSCDCVCVTFYKQCILCKDTPDGDVKAWIEGMRK